MSELLSRLPEEFQKDIYAAIEIGEIHFHNTLKRKVIFIASPDYCMVRI